MKIATSRLEIVPFQEAFITEEYISWLNDKTLMQYSEQRHNHQNHESCLNYLKSFDPDKFMFAAIFSRELGIHIGNINAHFSGLSADMGLLIGHRIARGQGFGLEAWLAMIGFLFAKKNVEKVTAAAISTNTPMIQIMKKSLMEPEGDGKRMYRGQEAVCYWLSKEAFEKLCHENQMMRIFQSSVTFQE